LRVLFPELHCRDAYSLYPVFFLKPQKVHKAVYTLRPV
jgi:hypothetical protein